MFTAMRCLSPSRLQKYLTATEKRVWTDSCKPGLGRSNKYMLWTICIILLALWALGLATSYTAGGLIHLLLVVALVVMVIRVIQGRRIA